MAGVGQGGIWLPVAVTITLVLCTGFKSLMCFSLSGLDKNFQDTGVDDAIVVGGQPGKILFDGKELDPQLESSSGAPTGKLLSIILGQLMLPVQQEESMTKESAWKHLKPSLHCGQNKMEFRATGDRAADIQIDIGIVLRICSVSNVLECCLFIMHPPPLPQVLPTPCL